MRLAFSSALLIAGLCAVPAAAKETTIGSWKIMSGQSSAGGAFCTIQEDDNNSYVGIQAMLDGQYILAAMSKDWQWTVGQRYRSQWTVEKGMTWSGEALAVTPNIVILPVAPSSNPIESLAAGESMTVTVAGAEEGYNLETFGKAATVLKRCLANKGEF